NFNNISVRAFILTGAPFTFTKFANLRRRHGSWQVPSHETAMLARRNIARITRECHAWHRQTAMIAFFIAQCLEPTTVLAGWRRGKRGRAGAVRGTTKLGSRERDTPWRRNRVPP